MTASVGKTSGNRQVAEQKEKGRNLQLVFVANVPLTSHVHLALFMNVLTIHTHSLSLSFLSKVDISLLKKN